MLKKFVMALALAGLCSFGLVGCGGGEKPAPKKEDAPKKVEEKAGDAAEKAGDAVEKAGEKVEEKVEEKAAEGS